MALTDRLSPFGRVLFGALLLGPLFFGYLMASRGANPDGDAPADGYTEGSGGTSGTNTPDGGTARTGSAGAGLPPAE